MRVRILVLIPIIFSGLFLALQIPDATLWLDLEQNHPPKVTITTPENHSNIQPGQQVFYSIQVVDPEDGDSRYAEIVPNEVFLEVWFFPSEHEMINSEKQSISREDTIGLQVIKESGCFNCHNSKTAFVGPAFYKIAQKYQQQDIHQLVSNVLNGSSGNWSSAIMPSQVDINEKEARQAVQWILSNAENQHRTIYSGTSGSFPTQPEKNKGVYMLTASYTDHGVDQDTETRVTGKHQVVLKISEL